MSDTQKSLYGLLLMESVSSVPRLENMENMQRHPMQETVNSLLRNH